MADVFHMKALCTFYGTAGYIAKGQEFFTTSRDLAEMYVAQQKAIYTDGTEPMPILSEDLKLQAQNSTYQAVQETEFRISEMERNVTSMANPINVKIAIEGINPEDLTVEVVPTELMEQQTEQVREQQSDQPQENQAEEPIMETPEEETSEYQTQEVTPKQPQDDYSGESEAEPYENNQVTFLEERKKEILQELNRLNQEIELQNAPTNNSSDSVEANEEEKNQDPTQEEDQPAYEVRHVGGGWYDLPNGERIQGKQVAEERMQEILSMGNSSEEQERNQLTSSESEIAQADNPPRAFTPNADRVRNANFQPEDGASLNQAQKEWAENRQVAFQARPEGLSDSNEDLTIIRDTSNNRNQGGQSVGNTTGASGAGGNAGTSGTGETGGTGTNSGTGTTGNTGK